MTDLDRATLGKFADENKKAFEENLKTLVEIPSISSSPEHQKECVRVAEAAQAIIESVGGKADILDTPGTPMISAIFAHDPKSPTVTVYNHLDVQPANEPEWRTEPFAFIQEGDRYRGRGTTDDKGPALSALYGAVAAHRAGVPINIKLLWETEEEIGSPSFAAGLTKHAAAVKTESVVVSDTIWLTRGKPSTPAGLRGLQGIRITLETADHDLHSGLVGGPARNPLTELAWVIGEMVDGRTGKVKIPGFYDEVEELTIAEARDFAASGFSVETFMKDHEMKSIRMDDPLEVMTAAWAQPTFEVHGIVGGYTGPGIKSAVPARAEAKVSCRLVPNLTCGKVFDMVSAFVKERIPDAEIHPDAVLEPYKGKTTGPYADAVREAYHFGFGSRPAFTREGGSIGAVPTMAEMLGVDVYFLGLSLPEHGYHAPNENYDWEQASGGIPMFAKYFAEVATRASRA